MYVYVCMYEYMYVCMYMRMYVCSQHVFPALPPVSDDVSGEGDACFGWAPHARCVHAVCARSM